MKIALLVLGSPLGSAGADSAWQYANAALRVGHELPRVFFFHEGVYNGNDFAAPAQDETDRLQRWATLAQGGATELVLCVASAARRGVLDSDESERHGKAAGNMHPAFTVGGLGLLIDAATDCERLVTFGP